ncbi:MAG TPA: hypothetical protein ENK82_07910 [Campylobacterales bacterium]|nr:hypothetical protein [Campylobacterales bacterium]
MNGKKSLNALKKKLKNQHNAFATIRNVYGHLSYFTNQEILDYYNVSSLAELNEHLEYLKKSLKEKNSNYEETLQELDSCFCLDSKGDFKYLYITKKEDQAQLNYSWKSKKIKLKLYACPYHCGWHLSKV